MPMAPAIISKTFKSTAASACWGDNRPRKINSAAEPSAIGTRHRGSASSIKQVRTNKMIAKDIRTS